MNTKIKLTNQVLYNSCLKHICIVDQNADQVEGVVAAANLCHCLISEASCKAALKELFSGGKLKCLFNVATTGHAQTVVLRIASFVSPDDVHSLFK